MGRLRDDLVEDEPPGGGNRNRAAVGRGVLNDFHIHYIIG